ncbi:MAG: HAMP domain-containing sensor histidine kinase, partial [Prolixibacteraceae bacterium]|nr:HAMP domain-containing sensor histidine kinase [Prolixibacteraceae bacterium]
MTNHFSNWEKELLQFTNQSKSLCVAIFDKQKNLLFANRAMKMLFKNSPVESFINPTVDTIIEKTGNSDFNGVLTIGSDIDSNSSISGTAFQRGNEILICGEVDTTGITQQNISLAKLNREVNNLQRQLIKEKKMLQATNAKLEELNKSQNILLGTAAHDLRNPIATNFSLAELITDNKDDYSAEELTDFVELIKENSSYTLNLLNSLLDLSSIRTGKINLKIENCNYAEIVESCIKNNKAFAENKDIKIKFKPVSETESCNIDIDPIRLEQVLNNLISNAIKYSNPNTEVSVQLSCAGDNIKTEVKDQGMGIAPDEAKKLFNPFQTTSNKSTGGEKSTGLGLAITKKVIDLHNGQINVESEKGKGSNFYFTIPKYQA